MKEAEEKSSKVKTYDDLGKSNGVDEISKEDEKLNQIQKNELKINENDN